MKINRRNLRKDDVTKTGAKRKRTKLKNEPTNI
jgi:hypothetical protein